MGTEVGRKEDIQRAMCCIKTKFYLKKKVSYIRKCGLEILHTIQTLGLFEVSEKR